MRRSSATDIGISPLERNRERSLREVSHHYEALRMGRIWLGVDALFVLLRGAAMGLGSRLSYVELPASSPPAIPTNLEPL
jgi:hypothetical protein